MKIVISLILLVALGYAGFEGLRWVGAQYALLSEAERPIVALASVLTVVAALVLSGAIRWGAREQAQRGLVERRYQLYRSALATLQQEPGEPLPTLQVDINQGIELLGSRSVIHALRKVHEEIARQGAESPELPGLMKELTLAMRADLGQSNVALRGKPKAAPTRTRSTSC